MLSKSIVIVDDDPDLVNMFSEALRISGYEICSFINPHLAYENIKDNPNKYSLLITGDKILDMDGLFLSTKLLEINPKLSVILLTNFKALKCNYKFNVLKKQISISKLINTVNESIVKSISCDNKLYN